MSKFKELNDTTFLCHFVSMKDKERVIHGAPWHFEHALVLTEDISTSIVLGLVSTRHAFFWVQIHNVRLPYMSKSIGE